MRFRAEVKRIRMTACVEFSVGSDGGRYMDRIQIRKDDIPEVKFVLVEGEAGDLADASYSFRLNDQDGEEVFSVANAKFDASKLADEGYVMMALSAEDTATAVSGGDAELKAEVGDAIYTVYVGVWDIIADLV